MPVEGYQNRIGYVKIPSNKVGAVCAYFRTELKEFYEQEEISIFLFWCFEAFLRFRDPSELVLRSEETMSESDLLRFNFAVKDLKKHRPIQHILGKSVFYGLTVQVNEQVLIPRPETEELTQKIILDYQERSVRILDIGTGSGCIAIALKKQLPDAEVHALDVSEAALRVALGNAKRNQTEISFHHADILSDPVQFPELEFDVIVSNPPYIRKSEKETMEPVVFQYEPHLALFVEDEDALVFYRKICLFAETRLKQGGSIYFEINEALGTEVVGLLESMGYMEVSLFPDLNGKSRMVRGRKK